jgi:hypothetical protein
MDESATQQEQPDSSVNSWRTTSLWSPFLAALPITGASISVLDNERWQSTVGTSDSLAAQLDELQFDLGEGPRWECLKTARPVLVPHVDPTSGASWPMFDMAVRALEVGALFAFPLHVGAAVVGVVDMYRSTPGTLDRAAIGRATAIADGIALRAVRLAVGGADNDRSLDTSRNPAMRREVHQATGMILIQLDTSATEAFSRLRAHAFSSGRSMLDVSRDVLAHRIDFGELPEE